MLLIAETNEVREMFTLGEAVFLEGVEKLKECKLKNSDFNRYRDNLIIKKRLAVVEFVHGLELILKAILIKKDYCIYKPKHGLFKNSEKVKNNVDKNNTFEFRVVIEFFKGKYSEAPFDGVKKLHKLRNQIIHKGTDVDEKKRQFFIDAIDSLKKVYSIEEINHRKFLKTIEESKSEI